MKQFDSIIIEYFTANSGIVNRRGYDMTASKKRQVLKLDNQQCVIVAKILSRFISKLQDSTTLVSFFEPKLKQKKKIIFAKISRYLLFDYRSSILDSQLF